MESNKKLMFIVIELFIRGKECNISLVFIFQSYIRAPKNVRLSKTHSFIMKVPNKRELQQIALNNSSYINLKHLI